MNYKFYEVRLLLYSVYLIFCYFCVRCINICWLKKGNESWKGEIRKEEGYLDISVCNYISVRLNI